MDTNNNVVKAREEEFDEVGERRIKWERSVIMSTIIVFNYTIQ